MSVGRLSLVLALVLSAGLAGCLNDFDEVRLNRVFISGIDVAAPAVGTGIVTLVANVTVDNREADSGPLTLLVKAHNTATGLLVATEEAEVGRIERDRSEATPVALRLPKEDGYRITALLFENEERRDQAVVQVSKVSALAVNVVETGLAVSGLEFLVENVTGSRVRIAAQVYLTNEGTDTSIPLRLQVKAREVSTGLLSDEQWADVEGIGVEATRIREVVLEVPDAYNYLVEAVLWQDEFVVGKGQGKVQLLPTFTIPKDEEIVVDKPVVEDFIQRGESGGDRTYDSSEEEATPAPAAVLVVAALAATLFWFRRRT